MIGLDAGRRHRRIALMTPGTCGAGDADDGEIHLLGDGGNVRIGLDAHDAWGVLGLTGNRSAERVEMRFQSTVRPTAPAFSVAPMTATVLGIEDGSSGR